VWTPLRQEIEQIRNNLNFSEDLFKAVGLNDWKAIEDNIYKKFCKINNYKNKPGWIWNCLKQETYSVKTDNFPAEIIKELLKGESWIWFFVNETVNEKTKFWWYEGEVNPILAIINESALIDEFYLASKKYDWLLCFNHHDILISAGKELASKPEDFVTFSGKTR
jgi:hypothetical protein